MNAFISGNGLVIALWVVAATGLVVTTSIGRKRWSRASGRTPASGLITKQQGVSYTLGFVLTIPVYLLFVLMILETTVLLMTRIATVYAACAGARSNVVWHNFNQELAEQRCQQAVVSALTPFVVATDSEGSQSGTARPEVAQESREYVSALQSFAGDNVDSHKVQLRYRRVDARTELAIERSTDEVTQAPLVTVTVRYQAPLFVPGVARLLDHDGRYPYERVVTSKFTMPLEQIRSDDGTLGIAYQPH